MSFAANQVRLVKIGFIGVPTEQAMHYRPYQSRFDGEVINALDNLTEGGRKINVERFSTIAGSVIAPAAQTEGRIKVPFGWDQRRFSVLMEFEVTTPMGTSREIITGFTGYSDLSYNKNLAPETPIFANSHTVARMASISQDNSAYSQVGYSGLGSRQVLAPIHYEGHGGEDVVGDTMLRPIDAFAHQQREAYSLNSPNTSDPRTDMRLDMHTSKRENVIGSNYLHKVWSGYRSALANHPEESDTAGYIMGAAVDDPAINENVLSDSSIVFKRLKEQSNLSDTHYVTVGELMSAFPEFEHVKNVSLLDPKLPQHIGDTAHWGGNNPQTRIAHSLSLSIPALMASKMLGSYSFMIENMTDFEGKPKVIPTGYQFMIGLSREQDLLWQIEESIRTNIYGNIRGVGGFERFSVIMSCNIIGSNTISVQLDDQPPMEFSAPSYCDSIYTPVVGSGNEALTQLSTDLGGMLTSIYDNHNTYY